MDGRVGTDLQGTLNLTDITAETSITGVVGLSVIKVFYESLEVLIHSVSTRVIPTLTIIALVDCLEVLANFLSNVVGTIRENVLEISFKRRRHFFYERVNIGPLKFVIPNLIDTVGRFLQPLSPCAIFGVKRSNYPVQLSTMTSPNISLTPLQHPYREGYGRITQPMCGHVGRSDARAGNETGRISITLIPNELLNSFGQLGNETILTITIQRLLDLCNHCSKLRIGTFNFIKQALNLLSEGSGDHDDTTTTRTTTIYYITVLVSLLETTLGENIVTTSRQKSTH
ncbi:uncharacterized protein BcabD6B2_41460 [Babesia caballi]|uniref:Uncharacterized protein n=1 Tax=Babesia caballi TaxID=5871 RepID=A0AAV4LX00_BABCB|nr:hypothetical protein, conserved [Babesia caballi]